MKKVIKRDIEREKEKKEYDHNNRTLGRPRWSLFSPFLNENEKKKTKKNAIRTSPILDLHI